MRYRKPYGLLSGFMVDHADKVTPELVHAGEQWAPKNFPIGVHHHDCWELYFQAHGESSWITDERIYPVAKSGFLAMPPGVVHSLDRKQTVTHHFLFAAIDVKAVQQRIPTLDDVWNQGDVLIAENAAAVEAPFRQLIREVTLDLPLRSWAIRCAIDSLLIEATRSLVQRRSGEHQSIAIPFMHPAVLRAKEMVDTHPSDRWNVPDLAGLVGLSTSHFSDRFLKDVGMSPYQYLSERRLAAAKELLLTTDLSVTSIAVDLGFSSSQHFSGAFRKHAGQTPSDFRKSERMRLEE